MLGRLGVLSAGLYQLSDELIYHGEHACWFFFVHIYRQLSPRTSDDLLCLLVVDENRLLDVEYHEGFEVPVTSLYLRPILVYAYYRWEGYLQEG